LGKILLVDDAVFMRARCGKLLAEYGHDVHEAADGSEAVQKYRTLKPDLVLMDITMPVMDGITAVKEIIKLDPAARIIMCSALAQKAMVMESIKAGAKDFIVKPYEPERVITAVNKALG